MRFYLLGIWLGLTGSLYGQADSAALPVEVDFLLNYYEQDGDHSAVTGGIGTQELRDREMQIVALVPLDSVSRLHLQGSLNHYTSASTDRIDSYVSSASIRDSHATLRVGYEWDRRRHTWGVQAGAGIESDYLSTSLGAYWLGNSPDENRQLALRMLAFFDTWIVIFPEELRAPGLASVPTNKRRSFSFSGTWSQVISPRLQAALTLETVAQQGLLATAFHRVYHHPDSLPRIETLPNWRLKLPVALRLTYFPLDWLVLRSYYRYYWDSFSLQAHTFSLETPVKIGPFFSFYPFYRFHRQTAARYFAPFGEHDPAARYFTSDYDLSAFRSHKAGIGLTYAPLYGLLRGRTRRGRRYRLQQMELRTASYWRSDGLQAWTLSLGLGWEL